MLPGTLPIATGIGLLLFAFLYLYSISRRGGFGFEYASALTFGEAGLLFVAYGAFPVDRGGNIIVPLLAASVLVSTAVWVRLAYLYKKQGHSPLPR